jgi:hypothetical protein
LFDETAGYILLSAKVSYMTVGSNNAFLLTGTFVWELELVKWLEVSSTVATSRLQVKPVSLTGGILKCRYED